jgi:hypothetical protein
LKPAGSGTFRDLDEAFFRDGLNIGRILSGLSGTQRVLE